MSEAPPFWFKPKGPISWALAPIGFVYGRVAANRMQSAPRAHANVPVICIGNLIVGGAGKTPTAIALAKVARSMKFRPGFLSRGYGGSRRQPTLVNVEEHNAQDVGDEPLILAQYAATVVSSDRPKGAALLEEQGVDLIIMDDGFQNPALHKDYSLLVIDAGRGIGNGFCVPAGPVRATLQAQLSAASAMLLIGKSQAGTEIVRRSAKAAKPIMSGELVVRRNIGWEGAQVLAYAGIADPAKFYRSLESVGADVVVKAGFHDHHPFSEEECQDLIASADSQNLTLVTTEKDAMRLLRMGGAQEKLRKRSRVLLIDMEFENVKMAEMIVRQAVEKFDNLRLERSRKNERC